jgi:hypothetical protein
MTLGFIKNKVYYLKIQYSKWETNWYLSALAYNLILALEGIIDWLPLKGSYTSQSPETELALLKIDFLAFSLVILIH